MLHVASSTAIARPMPDEAPVSRTHRPSKSMKGASLTGDYAPFAVANGTATST